MGLNRTDEFRQDAVRIALTSGLTRKQVADDLGVGMSTLNHLPADAGGICDVLLQVLKYDVFGDCTVGR